MDPERLLDALTAAETNRLVTALEVLVARLSQRGEPRLPDSQHVCEPSTG